MINNFVEFVQDLYATKDFIPLHAPVLNGNEKQFVADAIDSTFVSSVSEYVLEFEKSLCEFTGASYAIPIVNGTSALHLALYAAGAGSDCEVITQSLTFAATSNAIAYTGAQPVFIDVEQQTLGLNPDAVRQFLEENADIRNDGHTYNKSTNKRIVACVPMHTFGHPLRIEKLADICKQWSITLIEDAAEALGSYVLSDDAQQHCGTFGQMGMLSFNGNKIITTGGGGAILTNDEQLANKLRHLSTTAKTPHAWEYAHNEIGFNYRMPGLNAALGCAQMQQLDGFLKDKRNIAHVYSDWANSAGYEFITEPEQTRANYWLNALLLKDKAERDDFLKQTNEQKVMTRPAWEPMHQLPQFAHCQHDDLMNTVSLAQRIVNIPSSPRGIV